MLTRIKDIAHKIKLKLEDKSYMASLKKHMKRSDKWLYVRFQQDLRELKRNVLCSEEDKEDENLVAKSIFPYYLQLLAIACTYHLEAILVELLSIGEKFNKDIHVEINQSAEEKPFSDRPLIDQPLSVCRTEGSPNTLLGLAALHGYLNLVIYLVEKKHADVNAASLYDQDTPLHKAVKGDSYPINHSSYGIRHAEIAQYLIDHKADLTIKNREGKTPFEIATAAKPPFFSFSTNAVRAEYFADRVRPVLEKSHKELLLNNAEKEDTPEASTGKPITRSVGR